MGPTGRVNNSSGSSAYPFRPSTGAPPGGKAQGCPERWPRAWVTGAEGLSQCLLPLVPALHLRIRGGSPE
eukprot:3995872-Pyramimonas_sp.AAC.1